MPSATPAPSPVAAQPAPAGPLVPRWAVHRRLYDWMLSFASSRYASFALFLFSFCESIFVPIPPDVLQVPLTLERRDRAWYYATVNTLGSVVGGVVAFGLGYWMGPAVQKLFAWIHLASPADWEKLADWTNSLWVLIIGAILFHPYKVYTIGCGILDHTEHGVSLYAFVIASLIGRGLRFFAVAALLWFFGPPVKALIERYFHAFSLALAVLIIAGFFLLKVL
jgi:membrane protein YqaA with SNARE-associated domain